MIDQSEIPEPRESRPQPARMRRFHMLLCRFVRQCWYNYIWPSVEPFSADEEQAEENKNRARKERDLAQVDKQGSELKLLESGLAECKALFEAEQERRRSVMNRLTAVVALTSVLAAVVVGLAPSKLKWSVGGHSSIGWMLFILASILTLYAVVQLLCGLLAAVKGLVRRPYLQPEVVDVLPDKKEIANIIRLRMKVYIECLHNHQEINNEKVGQMDVAHQAIKNFLWAMLVLVVVLIAIRYFL